MNEYLKQKRLLILLLSLICLLLFGCNQSQSIVVPDVIGVDEDSAEQILISAGLVPEINYVSDEEYEKGKVTYTFPEAGYEIGDENKRVQLFVSVGKSEQFAKSYECVDVKDEGYFNFEIESLSIKDNQLNISLEVEPLYDGGTYIKLDFLGSGIITFNEMNKKIPITYTYDKKRITYGEKQNITISIPLESFDGETVDRFRLTIDFNVNQPDWNFKPYDKTSTASTFWWKIEW